MEEKEEDFEKANETRTQVWIPHKKQRWRAQDFKTDDKMHTYYIYTFNYKHEYIIISKV